MASRLAHTKSIASGRLEPVYEIILLRGIRLLALQDDNNSKISTVIGGFHGQFTLKGRSLDSIEERAERRLKEAEAKEGKKLELMPDNFIEDLSRRRPHFECSYFIIDRSATRQAEFDKFKPN